MIRVLTLAIFAAELLVVAQAYPCSCIKVGPISEPSRKEMLDKYDAVFTGDVVAIRLLEIPADASWPEGTYSEAVCVTLRVHKAWKGVTDSFVNIQTGTGAGDCGYSFAFFETFLVFADADESSTLHTGICKPTALEVSAQKQLEILGPPNLTFPFINAQEMNDLGSRCECRILPKKALHRTTTTAEDGATVASDEIGR